MNSVRLLLRSLIARYHAADDDDNEHGHPTALFESPSSAPPPLQTVLSTDDELELAKRARSPTPTDLHALMADEDARRARLFQREGRGAKAARRGSRCAGRARRLPARAAAHAARRLLRGLRCAPRPPPPPPPFAAAPPPRARLHRVPPLRPPLRDTDRVPRAGGWLCRPQEVLPEAEQVADLSLDDSEYTLCVRQADVVERDEHSLTKAGTYTCAPRDFGAIRNSARNSSARNSWARNSAQTF